MSLPKQPSRIPFAWELNWKVCVFSALLLPLLCGLGLWQLERAEEKLTLQQSLELEQAKPAIAFEQYQNTADVNAFSYREVTVMGHFLVNTYWLMENKVHQGQIGFEVLMPFMTDTGQMVMVNRGWVPGLGYRDRLPEITTPENTQTLSGRLVRPTQNTLLADAKVAQSGWPKLILESNFAHFEQALGHSLWPQILQLEPFSPGAFITQWQPINMTAAKHQAYAVQWFGLAIALAVLTLIANSNLLQWLKQNT